VLLAREVGMEQAAALVMGGVRQLTRNTGFQEFAQACHQGAGQHQGAVQRAWAAVGVITSPASGSR
jgi:Zn-dependent metalloprotease